VAASWPSSTTATPGVVHPRSRGKRRSLARCMFCHPHVTSGEQASLRICLLLLIPLHLHHTVCRAVPPV